MTQSDSPNQVSVTPATSRIGPTYAVQTAAQSIRRLPQRSNRSHKVRGHGRRRKGWRAGTPRVLPPRPLNVIEGYKRHLTQGFLLAANCGETRDLLKCSRCQSAWFCSVKCQKAYWPFHKAICYRNEFADATQASEPKFAQWMRKHQKMAVLKDDEVDRIERASKATTGPNRQEVIDSMYNRLNPKPRGPTYSAEEMIAMRKKDEQEEQQARLVCSRDQAWNDIRIPADMGMDCGHYKWYQNQSIVELAFPVPENVQPKEVHVNLKAGSIEVCMGPRTPLRGPLYASIKVEESTWYVQDRLLTVQLLKRNRRGHYANGSSNADTFWMSVVKSAPEKERLQLEFPPSAYYHAPIEPEAEPAHRMLPGKKIRARAKR